MSGLGLMKKYSIKDAREDIYQFFSSGTSNKENTRGIDRATSYLDSITDKNEYALIVSSIALHISIKAALSGSARVWTSIKRRMGRSENPMAHAILGVLKQLESGGREVEKDFDLVHK